MRPLKLILASVLALLLLAPAPAGANWAQPGYSATNLRSSPIDSALSAANVGQLEQRWVWSLPIVNEEAEQASGPPLVTAGMVFVRVNGQRIHALDAATGAHAWQADLGFETGVQDIAAYGNTLYAVSGKQLMSFPARCRTDGGACAPRVMASGAAILGTPVITATRVLVVERDLAAGYRLLAFDRSCLKDCAALWRYRYSGALSNPSAGNGLAWVGTQGGSILGFPLDCAPSASGSCAYTRRAAASGRSFIFSEPSVTAGRIYTRSSSGFLYAFPTDCAEVCGPAWRSDTDQYGWPSVTGSRVWVSREADGTTMQVDAFSTVCSPVAGKCRPVASIDASDGQPASPRGVQRRVTVADGMVFIPIFAQQNHPGGVKVYAASSCGPKNCAALKRLGGELPRGPATIANGMVYMAEEVPVLDGSDPGPWFSSVRAFALPEPGAS